MPRITLPFADGEYEFFHSLERINEIETKCGGGYGEVGARLFAGRYVNQDGEEFGHPEDAKWKIRDIVEVIREGLIGGGKGYVNDIEIKIDDYRANQLVKNYVLNGDPFSTHWTTAAAIMAAHLVGYESKKKAVKKPNPNRKAKASSGQKDTQGL